VAVKHKGFHRKLTTILSASVAGYSSLMQDGEAATLKFLEAYKQIIPSVILNLIQTLRMTEELQ
jgi:hypothetical protein